jgi:two-component system alkaline phosphatase synthesis response regulator PhoP
MLGECVRQKGNAMSEPTHKVLIVEDTVELAEIVQVTLERLNLRVFHETHGQRALEVYDAQHPDLVLLDIALPDMTGWQVLQAIQSKPYDGKTPRIIVITAYGDPANRLMGKLQDIQGYLIKPLEPDEIEAVVLRVLGIKKPESDSSQA